MTASRGWLVLAAAPPLVAFAVCALACHGSSSDSRSGPLISTTAATGDASQASNPPPHPTGSAGAAHTPLCRAIAVTGSVRHVGTMAAPDAGVVKAGDLAGEDYLDLAGGSRLSIKNGNTSREGIFEGVGSLKVCVGGEEEMWLPVGSFTSVPGAGEGPGAEEWIVTPEGVVRYDVARLHVVASSTRADVTLGSGNAWAYPIDGAYEKPDTGGGDAGPSPHGAEAGLKEGKSVKGGEWVAVPAGKTFVLTSRRSTSQIVSECEELAKSAHDLAIAIASRDASLAEASPRHVRLRQKAHAVCAVAEVLAGRSLEPVERERLLPRVHAAAALWQDNGEP